MADNPGRHHVYCDESSMECRFMVYGGLITTEENVLLFDDLISKWREEHKMKAEMKWAKVSKTKLDKYLSFTDIFFDHALQNYWHFKSVVFDTSKADYKTYHDNDCELAFYKFYYQFLIHKFSTYATTEQDRLWVYIDQRSTTKERLADLHGALNNGIRKKRGWNTGVVTTVEARCSHDCNLIQLADVMMGAIAYHCNGCHKADNASAPRVALASHIAKRAGLSNLAQATVRGKSDFEIWRFAFGAGK